MKRSNLLTAIFTVIATLTFTIQVASAASYSDLTSYQKQKYWDMWTTECQPLLMSKQYTDYRTCALNVMEKASQLVEPQEIWCTDSDDGIDWLKKGIVKTDLDPVGVEDYVYIFDDGSQYLFERGCSDTKKLVTYHKNCAELGPKYVADVAAGACVLTNVAPTMQSIGDMAINEADFTSFLIIASDENGDALTYSAKGLPASATFVNQTFSWTPNYKQQGNYVVTFTVSDGKLETSQTISIQVNDAIPPCVKPKDGMKIVDDTYLCPGSYLITAPITFEADNVKLQCQGATIYGNGLAQPIIVKDRNNIGIINCKFEKFADGILFQNVMNSQVIGNVYTDIGDYTKGTGPLRLFNSSGNKIGSSSFTASGGGVLLNSSSNNIVENCLFDKLAIQTDGKYNGTGVQISGSNNIIEKNTFLWNGNAISTWWGDDKSGNENIIRDNTFQNNQAAITILSKTNKIYRNNFINNGGLSGFPVDQQVVIPGPITENIFTVNGEGNYWSNYDEVSESCFDNDADGICDNAFNKIATDNYDLAPYLKPNGWIK